MNKDVSKIYKSPIDKSDFKLIINESIKDNIISGELVSSFGHKFKIIDSIPNFTDFSSMNSKDKKNKTEYDLLSDTYENYADIPFLTFKAKENNIRRKMIDKLNIKKNSKILEIGAGDGRSSEFIAKKLGKNAQFFIQDLSLKFLQKAKIRLNKFKSKTKLEFSVANAIELPFPDNYFNCAHHFGGLNTFSDIKKFLSEITRVVKPGGKIVIGDESIGPWLKNTEFGKIMMNSNPLLNSPVPIDLLPENIIDVNIEWIMMGAYYILDFKVLESAPVADYFVPIPGKRGGNHWIRYYGNLEGVTDETKKLALKAAKKSGLSMHQWLEKTVKKEAKKTLK